ncbi:DegT/DnrJ/EryC1/StrS family aminotransferase [Ruegeria arenilitoris]|uniref:DegT/DnrJ/EryC1/StrS family aminotransferase n=1 Tax=Ruegeria arenilitoris TaxID=1173585 RepID=UPI00147BCABA|nr:DegT/DnrJ/EryC1/StrS family aminotransferase [Ruegeria arenilitoris]
MADDIFVTRPYLPPLDEFKDLLGRIWDTGVLTNCGPYHQELEEKLCEYLNVPHISLFNNGTIALVVALRALGVKGEVITTPYSFVATSHAILWTDCTPVFVDVEPGSLNLGPSQIEVAITENTAAILPVHCYGHPADVDAIDAIGAKYGIPVIYDAAHAFGVECHCGSVLTHGDLSVLSFHATKVFNTFEGGAIVCKTPEMKRYIDQLKNFGHHGETSVIETGINGKMSEINAAFGLLQLGYVDDAIAKRAAIDERYRAELVDLPGFYCLGDTGQTRQNYAYFPVRIGAEFPMSRDALYYYMKERGVHPRRYFYPLISEFPMYRNLSSADSVRFPNAATAAEEILCLPIYPDLDDASVTRIITMLRDAAASRV